MGNIQASGKSSARLEVDLSRDEGPPGGRIYPGMESVGAGGPWYGAQEAGASGMFSLNKAGPTSTLSRISQAVTSSSLRETFVAGAIGGFLGWIVAEPFTADGAVLISVFFDSALFAAITSMFIAAGLGSYEAVCSRAWHKALRLGGMAAFLGVAGGIPAGLIAQAVYGSLGGGALSPGGQILVRAVGWGVMGLFSGLASVGYPYNPRRLVNGIIGGGIGGFVGGLLFDPVGYVVCGGGLSRCIAVSILGAAIGSGSGLVAQVRKQAWLKVVGGPFMGKEFILYDDQVIVGRAPDCNIVLFKDKQIGLRHILLERSRTTGGYLLNDLGTACGTMVNGRRVSRCELQDGDILRVGQTTFEYHEYGRISRRSL